MGKFSKKFAKFLVAVSAMTLLMGSSVFAYDIERPEEDPADTAGNVFVVEDQSAVYTKDVENELYMAGYNATASGIEIDKNAFMAGYNVSLTQSVLGGSAFVAGYNVTIDADADSNIFAAGYSINTSDDTEAKALRAVGMNATVNGTYDYVSVAGANVVFDAEVNGDVYIDADSVTFGDNAKINGNLEVKSAVEPAVSDTLVAGKYHFEEVKKEENTENASDTTGDVIDSVKKAGKKSIGAIFLKKVGSFFYWSFAYALLAVVFCLLFKNQMAAATEMIKTKTAPMIVSGAIGWIVIPVACIIVAITVIGLPLSGLTMAAYILTKLVSKVFVFASLGSELFFGTICKKRLHPMLEAVIMMVFASFIKQIPFIGKLVGLACFILMLGYIIMAAYSKFDKKEEA